MTTPTPTPTPILPLPSSNTTSAPPSNRPPHVATPAPMPTKQDDAKLVTDPPRANVVATAPTAPIAPIAPGATAPVESKGDWKADGTPAERPIAKQQGA